MSDTSLIDPIALERDLEGELTGEDELNHDAREELKIIQTVRPIRERSAPRRLSDYEVEFCG
ncbi:hypothetical protein ZOSMA_173G00190 [Zostera marina]|uniref:Uncharacterized protein n=1 Tax=Zostera marina TaxID=29655 RepID=A0A0K9PSD6_ZOSMR|nr:hypothetical protein ZOSMA_173G00190 [Zostera marina]